MALRTNSKEVKERIKKYIIDGFHDCDYESYNNVTVTDYSDICTIILSTLYKEKIMYDNRRNMTHYDYFVDWCAGLCSMVDTSFFYRSAVDILGGLLDETEQEKARFSETQAEKTMCYLLYREITKNARKGAF